MFTHVCNQGSHWIHDNTAVNVVVGDVVYYWVYVITDTGGYNLIEQSWTAAGKWLVFILKPTKEGCVL